jgi:5'-nucleotidase
MPAHRTRPTFAIRDPLILITNDDGITSPGLRATVQAVLPLGDPLVVAPARQWSGAGRSMPQGDAGRISRHPLEVDGQPVAAYQVDSSPALAVAHALLGLVPRRPALLISGINYGENMGADVTISGTVGAALQGADLGIPALAVSLQTPKETHVHPSDSVDFTAAIHFTRLFARWMLQVALPFDVDVLKIDVPDDATPETAWRLTRVSRQAYFVATLPQQASPADPAAPPSVGRCEGSIDYEPLAHPERTDSDSDIYALAVDRVVSVAPLSLDLTSRADPGEIEALLRGHSHSPGLGHSSLLRRL